MSAERTVISGGHVITMDGTYGDLPNSAVRKRDGQLVGHDLVALRKKANAALDNIEAAVAQVPAFAAPGLAEFVGQAERGASVMCAGACRDLIPQD